MPLVRRREPFDDPGWLYELKLDGFRALAFVENGSARLVSRNGHVFKRFDSLGPDLIRAAHGQRTVLDGELVCLADDGRPDFQALLYRRAEPYYYYAFDLLTLDGDDLRGEPLRERKRRLRRLLGRRRGRVRYLDRMRPEYDSFVKLSTAIGSPSVCANPVHSGASTSTIAGRPGDACQSVAVSSPS